MATVTGMTAAAMIAIRDQMIIGAEINGSGHLIFTLFDETTVDAGSLTDAVGAASETVSGTVELATSAETTTGTDTTRAVTPAGLLAVSSTKQPLDDDLTAIANIVPSNDDFVQRKSGVWVNRTVTQVATDLSATLLMPKSGGTFTGAVTAGTTLAVTGDFTGASNQNMGAWTSFTPTWTGTGSNPSLGNGTLVGRHMRIGRLIKCHINLIPGSTTTFGTGTYAWALPVASANVGCTMIGNAQLSASSRWMGQVIVIPNATTCTVALPAGTADTSGAVMGPATPITFANAQQLRMTFDYEAAS